MRILASSQRYSPVVLTPLWRLVNTVHVAVSLVFQALEKQRLC